MFVDHENYSKEAKENGWINPTIEKVVKNPLDEDMIISDKDYIGALETMIFWFNFMTGLNTSIGYDDSTRHHHIYNFYNCLERIKDLRIPR